MRWTAAVMALVLLTNSVVASAETSPAPFDIMGTKVAYLPRGGCTIAFELKNDYSETLAVSADVYISTFDNVTVGEAYLHFPPAVAGGRSQASATFYDFKLAGGDCPHSGFKFTVATKFCDLVGSRYKLSDRACLFTKEFNYGKPI